MDDFVGEYRRGSGKTFLRAFFCNLLFGPFTFLVTYFCSDSLAGRMGSLAGFGGWLFLLGVALSVLRFIFLIEFEELAAFLFSAASFLVGTVLMIVGWMKWGVTHHRSGPSVYLIGATVETEWPLRCENVVNFGAATASQ